MRKRDIDNKLQHIISPKRPPHRIECIMNEDVTKRQFNLLFTRSQVYDDFSPASFDAKHWNIAESSIDSFLINSEWSSCTVYLLKMEIAFVLLVCYREEESIHSPIAGQIDGLCISKPRYVWHWFTNNIARHNQRSPIFAQRFASQWREKCRRLLNCDGCRGCDRWKATTS